jgi:hypothetical protein
MSASVPGVRYQLPEQRRGRFVHRFDARGVGSVWEIWDGGVMSWRTTDLAEDDREPAAQPHLVTVLASATQPAAAGT